LPRTLADENSDEKTFFNRLNDLIGLMAGYIFSDPTFSLCW
jgi:hypothetical protein